MSKKLSTLFAAVALFAASVSLASAEEPNRDDALKAYDQVLVQGKAANTVIKKGAAIPKTVIDSKPVRIAGTPVSSAVKFWVEILDANRQPTGRLVDPSKYKWQRNEPFRVWFESAAPVVVALYQTYPDPKPSDQIVPDRDYPETFEVVPAGQKFVFPVNFRTDDNLVDEHLSLILVRADATIREVETAVIPVVGVAPAIAVNSPSVGIAQDAQIVQIVQNGDNNTANVNLAKVNADKAQDIVFRGIKSCSDAIDKAAGQKPKEEDAEKEREAVAKCRLFRPARPVIVQQVQPVREVIVERIVTQPVAAPVFPNEAATVLLGAGKITQTQIILHKD